MRNRLRYKNPRDNFHYTQNQQLLGVSISPDTLAAILGIVTAGNLIGGVGVVALSHLAQASILESASN